MTTSINNVIKKNKILLKSSNNFSRERFIGNISSLVAKELYFLPAMRDDHLFPQHKPIHLHRRGLIAPIVASLKNHSSNTHLQNQISKVINCSFRIGPKRQTNKKSEREFHLVMLIFLRRIYLFMLQQLSPISAAHRVRSCELQDSVIETTQFRAL